MLHTPHVSCCASLRQALLQGWQQGFPLHASPFRQMAARSGATPRELLGLCQDLHRQGALQAILPRWGDGLRRQRWRLAFAQTADEARLHAALLALPGCFHVERSTAPQPGLPALWAELETLNTQALALQLQRLPHPPVARWLAPEPAPADTADAALHDADDLATARQLERGLALCSRPYADCARHIGCSELKLLARLQAWRRTGVLADMTLKPPPTRVPQPGMLALWTHAPATPAAVQRLQDHPGVDRVIVGPAASTAPGAVDSAWPWALSVVLQAAPQLALDQLRETLAHTGVRTPDFSIPLVIEQPRDQALLFQTVPATA
ncbi:hypothetical protein [Roseateles sp. BYS87W]|uniref:Siroheme decarboxylase NirL-like HTH domain-containing protein n=1 Tax=Pelomonas baiyunensis TaxID=3299026 RepID=A0ABW7GTS5_9BURK